MKNVMIAVVAALGLTCACARDAGAQDTFGDGTRPCLSPDLFLSEGSNSPPTRIEGAPLKRLFANYSRFYRGPQAEVDLVLAYERDEVVLLVPFAEGCATSLPRKMDAETWHSQRDHMATLRRAAPGVAWVRCRGDFVFASAHS